MRSDPDVVRRAVESTPGAPADEHGPVFREPWEAQAFAMAVALRESGLFTGSEWATALAGEIARAQTGGDPDTGDTYYPHWLAALERLAEEKGAVREEDLERYRAAWSRAAARASHGVPIDLAPGDFD